MARILSVALVVFVVMGLAAGLGFGVFQEYDGKNLKALAKEHQEFRKALDATEAELADARSAVGKLRDRRNALEETVTAKNKVIDGLVEEIEVLLWRVFVLEAQKGVLFWPEGPR